MDDFLKTVKAQLYERVTSPLIFAVAVSWSLWNYRFILIVLSSLSATDKFFAIEMLPSQYISPFAYWLQFGFIFPVLSSIFYLFLLPYPSRWVYEYVRNEQKKLKEIQAKIDDEMPLTQEEARSLRSDLRLADKKLEDLYSEYTSNIGRLKKQVLELEEKNSELSRNLSPDVVRPRKRAVELSQLEGIMLRKIGEYASGVGRDDLFRFFGPDYPMVVMQHAIDGLLKKDMIDRDFVDGAEEFSTTVVGRDTIVGMINRSSQSS